MDSQSSDDSRLSPLFFRLGVSSLAGPGCSCSSGGMMSHKQAVKLGIEWCGLCYEGLRGRRSHPGHLGVGARAPGRRISWMAMQRREKTGPTSPTSSEGFLGSDWCKWYPGVVEFLSRSRWEDGTSRCPGTVMLIYEAGRWKLWCHDKDLGESMFISGATPEGALEAFEKALTEGSGDWRPDRQGGTPQRNGRR
jgi:hypothetical protein